MNRPQTSIRLPWVAGMALAGLALAGCVAHPPPGPVQRVYNEAPPPPPSPDVYAYPLHGQTPQQQDRDHYECSQWATQQTGFDPSAPGVPPHERVRVVSAGPPPGTGTAVGAVTGAIIGAAISRPGEAATRALAGAGGGGAIGNAPGAAHAQDAPPGAVHDRRQAPAHGHEGAHFP